MSSITRAVTARLNEFTHGRKRLTAEEKTTPSTSDVHFYIPPALIWEEVHESSKQPVTVDVSISPESREISKSSISPMKLTQKMSSVVRRLSPFSDDGNFSTLENKTPAAENTNEEAPQAKKGPFKDTKNKMDKLRKMRKTKDRQQLIDSDEDDS
ncbi:unnamed protein product [Caenorhabditis auriculariae]|uniref:Uncharacterized protein n=1 Tax=Caenorhabditis auriculariae TaxID=2777116 RepID=A0A8S1H339_9PELO|nr:unnamed protein product [Caenorhabditis auriculariae]